MSFRIATLLLFGALLYSAPASSEDEAEARQSTMREIYGALQTLLPLAMDSQGFAAPEREQEIEAQLARLARSAKEIRSHASELDAGALYIGHILERDAKLARSTFQRGDKHRSGFYVQQTVESCLACHSRREGKQDAAITAGFLSEPLLEELDPLQRGPLLFATRQFDQAALEFESALRSNAIPPFELLESLIDYMTLCVRVTREPGRTIPILRRVAERKDLWLQFRDDLKFWAKSLEEFAADPPGTELIAARKLIQQARGLGSYPTDRRAFAHYLVASRLLLDLLEKHPSPDPEAYYLLGVAESRIGRNHWLTQPKYYLELAVRMDPSTEVAYRAFALLEEEALVEYVGIDGVHLPDDIREHLDELRALVEVSSKNGG